MLLFGVYLILIGINYLPLLLHAIDISRRGTAQQEISEELRNRTHASQKYRRQSLLLLVPLMILVVAILQMNHDHR